MVQLRSVGLADDADRLIPTTSKPTRRRCRRAGPDLAIDDDAST